MLPPHGLFLTPPLLPPVVLLFSQAGFCFLRGFFTQETPLGKGSHCVEHRTPPRVGSGEDRWPGHPLQPPAALPAIWCPDNPKVS
jgi:hypothetical protein